MRRWLPCILLSALAFPGSAAAYTVKRAPGGQPVRWSTGTVTLQLHHSVVGHVAPGEARHALTIAADAWTGLGGPDVVVAPSMTRAPYVEGEAGVQVVWPEVWPAEPGLLAVTVTRYVQSTGRIVDADILLNRDFDLAVLDERDPDARRYDLASVLTHEVGHVLGLGETPDDEMATMWATVGRGRTHKRTVEADDIRGLEEVYAGMFDGDGGPEPSAGPTVRTYSCVRSTVAPRAAPGWLSVAGMLVLLAVVARRMPGRARVKAMMVATIVAATLGPAFAPSHVGAARELVGSAAASGTVERAVASRDDAGLVWTDLTVDGATVRVAGGCLDGLCVQVGDSSIPAVGERVVVRPPFAPPG